MIKYEFPCYPGDEVWYLSYIGDSYWCRQDKVEMVGFTTRSVQIRLRGHKAFGKTYTWGKNVFKTEHEALQMIAKLGGTLEE